MYLDDGTLFGSADDLLSALATAEEEGPPRRLNLNRKKSLLYIPDSSSSRTNPLPSEIPVSNSGFDLLGSPAGPRAFCEHSLHKRVLAMLDCLPDLEDAQMETAILRSCLAFPKISFSLRTCPSTLVAIKEFDNTMLEALSRLAGGPLPGWSSHKASLPTALGGPRDLACFISCCGLLPWLAQPV